MSSKKRAPRRPSGGEVRKISTSTLKRLTDALNEIAGRSHLDDCTTVKCVCHVGIATEALGWATCKPCNGDGHVGANTCPQCGGGDK